MAPRVGRHLILGVRCVLEHIVLLVGRALLHLVDLLADALHHFHEAIQLVLAFALGRLDH